MTRATPVRKWLLLVAVLAVTALTFAPAGTAAAGDRPGDTYNAYASVRSKLLSCSLDRTWRHLGADARKRCVKYRRLYILWSDPNFSGTSYHVHCRTAKSCPAAPIGEPDPRAPIPSGANVYR
jgi:hypothetical protein